MRLTVQDSSALKGIAILLMLVHHLFSGQTGVYDDMLLYTSSSGECHYLIHEIGILSKVCVAIFVFLSGYGLVAQAEKNFGRVSLKDYYLHRFKKLYLNYWFIWILFVPISIFCFNYTFEQAYHSKIVSNFLADILGIHALLFKDIHCYNPTWWFYSAIILLYLLFPFLFRIMRNYPIYVLLLSFIIPLLPIPVSGDVKYCFPTFVLGMSLSKNAPPTQSISNRMKSSWFAIVLLLLYGMIRNSNTYPLLIDTVLTLLIVMAYLNIKKNERIINALVFLGRHSMNIFLFHTFIYHFWFKDIVYFYSNPFVIFITLLALCIPISILLEIVKKYSICKL